MKQKKPYLAVIGFKTSNGDSASFDPWNQDALNYIAVGPGAIDPTKSHVIPISDWIEIWLKDDKEQIRSKKVFRQKS